MNESETLNRCFTIIWQFTKPYSIMLHVTYVYTMQADLQTAEGPETTYDWELAFHIYIYRERESSLCYISISSCVISYCVISRVH